MSDSAPWESSPIIKPASDGDAPWESSPIVRPASKNPATQRANKLPSMGQVPPAFTPTTPGEAMVRDTPIPSGSPTGGLDAMKAGMFTDPDSLVRNLAAKRFPNEPIEQAVQRYGVVDGDLVYREPVSGQLRTEFSGFGEFLRGVTEIGPAIAGGALGFAAGGPVGAAAGGAGAEGWRRIGGMLAGDEQESGLPDLDAIRGRYAAQLRDAGIEDTRYEPDPNAEVPILPTGNFGAMLKEMLINYVGAKLGGGYTKNVRNRLVARDIDAFSGADAQRLIAVANRHGIQLTPAEATNLGSLINRQTMLGNNMDEAGDIMRRFYGDRAEQVQGAVDEFIGRSASPVTAGVRARDVARVAKGDLEAARSSAARPFYRMTVGRDQLVPEREFMELESDDIIRGYIDKVTQDPNLRLLDAPRNSTAVIHAAGVQMREDMAKPTLNSTSMGRTAKGNVSAARDKLLKTMERTFGPYNEARTVFRNQSPPVEAMDQTLMGAIAETKKVSDLAKIPDKIMRDGLNDPALVADWRRQFATQGKQTEWDDLVAGYLRKTWEGMTENKGSELVDGAMWRKAVFGTQAKRKALREALGPERYRAASDLMEVLAATGRAPLKNSQTAMAEDAKVAIRREAAPILSAVKNWMRLNFGDAVIDWKTREWEAVIARALTSPTAMDDLANLSILRKASPNEERAIAAVGTILARAAAEIGAPTRSLPPEGPPPLAPR